MNRRTFTKSLLLSAAASAFAQDQAAAGRKLDLTIGEGFRDANPADIRAVLLSAAGEIWKHCPNTRWELPGFFVYRSESNPITLFDHRKDGRVAIGLNTEGRYWSQYAYQFSHEFCHALAGHSNEWRKTWIRERKANHWLEESLCETASLFALRAMAKSWQTTPPYPNWKSYGEKLEAYAADRLKKVAEAKKEGFTFAAWLKENEPAMRENSTDRDKNNIVAAELLPLFEATPSGWESLVSFNRTEKRDAKKSLAKHFADWSAVAPAEQREFIGRVAGVFGIKI